MRGSYESSGKIIAQNKNSSEMTFQKKKLLHLMDSARGPIRFFEVFVSTIHIVQIFTHVLIQVNPYRNLPHEFHPRFEGPPPSLRPQEPQFDPLADDPRLSKGQLRFVVEEIGKAGGTTDLRKKEVW